jgi:hypothetical protein
MSTKTAPAPTPTHTPTPAAAEHAVTASETPAGKAPSYYSATWFKASVVRNKIKGAGRRVNPAFLQALDNHIEDILTRAIAVNPDKVTLDATAAHDLGLVH